MFLRTGGYSIISDPIKGVTEMDSFTCKHCNRVVFVHARQSPEDLGGRCTICDSLICRSCVDHGTCDPFEEKLKRLEDPLYRRRSIHKVGGG